jgi:hypothetical protein
MKYKSLKSILLISLQLAILVISLSSCNQAEKAIKSKCPDCLIEEITGTDILIATNSHGLVNFYSTQNKSFMLTNWVEAKYSPGIIFDDITVTIDGQEIYLFKDDFSKISDSYIQQKLIAKNTEESNASGSASSSSNSFCSKHSKMYRRENGCSECLYDEVEDELNKPGGFRERASHM